MSNKHTEILEIRASGASILLQEIRYQYIILRYRTKERQKKKYENTLFMSLLKEDRVGFLQYLHFLCECR